MIDLAEMRAIEVDPEKRTVRAQGGANWAELNAATGEHGLAVTGGAISTTGISGLTLGGGLGWLMGLYGLAADNLASVELVTANGDVLDVTAELAGSVLGAAGRQRELRCRHDIRVSVAPGRHRDGRIDRTSVHCDTGGAQVLPRLHTVRAR